MVRHHTSMHNLNNWLLQEEGGGDITTVGARAGEEVRDTA